MRMPTYQEIENRIRIDLDLQDVDNFVQTDELAQYVNEAINDAEAEIMAFNEDYFLKAATLSLVQGAFAIQLPTDIYGQKIRKLLYVNGPLIYEVHRIRDLHKFYKRAELDYYSTNQMNYAYFLTSPTAGQQDQIEISPPAQESGAFLKLWYIRNAQRVPLTTDSGQSRTTQLATVIDIPEWADYLVQFAKVRCYEKEFDPRLTDAKENLANRKKMMVETLSAREPDNEDEIHMDLQFYYDHN